MDRATTPLRQAGRALARRPLYATVAVLTVGAGLAASIAAYVLVDAALLSPVPWAEPDRLVTPDVIGTRGFEISLSVPNYRDWSAAPGVFESTAASTGWSVVLTGKGPARVLPIRLVFGDLFGTLGMTPLHGRLLTAKDTERGAAPTIVISHAFFRELGGDPALVGSTLTLDDKAYTILGVLPPGNGYPSAEPAVYLSLGPISDLPWDDRDSSFGLRMLARLAPGVELAAAQRELDRIADGIAREEGREVARPRLESLETQFVGSLERPLLLLCGAAALVVLLAVANVANLFLARGETRRGELAVRAALGAPRSDLVRLQLAESFWIAALGALVGLLGAAALVSGLAARITDDVPRYVAERLALSPSAIVFALALAGVIAFLLGVVPALVLPKGQAIDALHGSGGQRAGTSRSATRLRSALVVGELALGTVLVAGAALLAESLDRLRTVDKGFETPGVVVASLSAPAAKSNDIESWLGFQRAALERVERLPGVKSAALALLLPLRERSWELSLVPEGRPWDPHEGDSVLYNMVSPGYFDTLGLRLVAGRLFDARDRTGGEPVTVVDESLAARYWPGESALGKRVAFEAEGGDTHAPGAKPYYRTIVGVVANLRHYELASPSRIQVYVPLEQTHGRYGMGLSLAVKADGAMAPLFASLPKAIAEIDADAPLDGLAPLEATIDSALAQPRLLSRTASVLGALALLLAGVGVFALASFGVAQRLRELGLRQALGATPRDVVAGVVRGALRWLGWGVAFGLAGAAGSAALARSLLYGVGPFDPSAHLGAVALLAVVTLAAAAGPALRAARVDPARILRDEA